MRLGAWRTSLSNKRQFSIAPQFFKRYGQQTSQSLVILTLRFHCFPKRIDQSVKKASDGGASETKEHWVYDVTIENKTFKELTNLDLKYGSEIRDQRSEVRDQRIGP